MIWIFWSVLLVIVAAPFVAYFTAKLGVYGALKARSLFRAKLPLESSNEQEETRS
jgi:hypothetical protein